MSSVNLTTFEEGEKKQINISGGALTGLVIALILVVILWGALVMYKKYYLQKNIDETKLSYSGYYDQFKDKESIKVIDFHRRLEVSGSLISQGKSVSDILSQIEPQMVPNVILTSFSYDEATSKISLNCSADNFNTVAKQIYSFKKSGIFSSVIAGSSAMDFQTNKVIFPVELKI
jgi:hypothetical protein